MAKPQKLALIKESKSPRGLVPSSSFGILDTAFNSFLDEVSPRTNDHAQFTLATATDARFREFLRIMGEARTARWSLAAIAKQCAISLPEFAEFWRKSQLQRALAQATNAIPSLTTDLISDAATQRPLCERCDGFGTVLSSRDDEDESKKTPVRTCPSCKGLGTTTKPGDSHARDKLLEMTGLSGRKGSAAVVINQNFAGMSIESATDRLNRISFSLDDDDAGTIDATSDSQPNQLSSNLDNPDGPV